MSRSSRAASRSRIAKKVPEDHGDCPPSPPPLRQRIGRRAEEEAVSPPAPFPGRGLLRKQQEKKPGHTDQPACGDGGSLPCSSMGRGLLAARPQPTVSVYEALASLPCSSTGGSLFGVQHTRQPQRSAGSTANAVSGRLYIHI